MNEENLDAIRKSLHQKAVEGQILGAHSNAQSADSTRFFLPVSGKNVEEDTMEIDLKHMTTLANLELNVHFDRHAEAADEADLLAKLKTQSASTKATSENKPEEKGSSSSSSTGISQSNENRKDTELPALSMTENDSTTSSATGKYLALTVNSFKGAAQGEAYLVSRNPFHK